MQWGKANRLQLEEKTLKRESTGDVQREPWKILFEVPAGQSTAMKQGLKLVEAPHANKWVHFTAQRIQRTAAKYLKMALSL